VRIPAIEDVRTIVGDIGWVGPVAYAALYAALTLTPTPATVLSVGAGALFGITGGVVVVMAGALVGAGTAFGLSRALGRTAVRRVDSDRLRRLDALVGRRGLLAVIGVRLFPLLPFGPLNYACGLTAVRTRDYLLGTAIGILPPATAFVTIGAYGSTPGSTPFVLALGGTAVLTLVATAAARRHRRLEGVTTGRDPAAGRRTATGPPPR
jgi:uncharacterized membrane protein YdjX (TVP38/TMEM64 family)